jgi:hypothetical protein
VLLARLSYKYHTVRCLSKIIIQHLLCLLNTSFNTSSNTRSTINNSNYGFFPHHLHLGLGPFRYRGASHACSGCRQHQGAYYEERSSPASGSVHQHRQWPIDHHRSRPLPAAHRRLHRHCLDSHGSPYANAEHGNYPSRCAFGRGFRRFP